MVKSLILSLILVFLSCGTLLADPRPASEDYRTANRLFAASKFREALPLYQKLLSTPPSGVSPSDIQSRIGDSWFRLNDYRRALDAYRIAVRGQKESLRPETQYWIGFCCFLLGRDLEAVDELLKVPALYPASGMWITTAYYWAGRASERAGKAPEAAEYYRLAGGNGKSSQGKFALRKAKNLKSGSSQ
jgi:tetratricopeptide (TPR) repeat protein